MQTSMQANNTKARKKKLLEKYLCCEPEQTLADGWPNNNHFRTADGRQDQEKVGMSTNHIVFSNDPVRPSAAVFHCTKSIRAHLNAAPAADSYPDIIWTFSRACKETMFEKLR